MFGFSKPTGLLVRSERFVQKLEALASRMQRLEALDERFFPHGNFAEEFRKSINTELTATVCRNAAESFRARVEEKPNSRWERAQIRRVIQDFRRAKEK